MIVSLKKKKFIFGVEAVDKKTFKLNNLGTSCSMEKALTMKGLEFTLLFEMNTPIRQKEYEEAPVKKLVIDSFKPPFRDGR